MSRGRCWACWLGVLVSLVGARTVYGGTVQACCLFSGGCLDLTPFDCDEQGGYAMGDGTACLGDGNLNGLDDACEISGGCCLSDGNCVDDDFSGCVDKQSGLWQGPGTACAGDNNGNGLDDLCEPTRACCHPDGTCSQLPPEECIGKLGGEPQAIGLDCAGDLNGNGIDDICEDIQACCLPSGECLNLTVPDCFAQGGDPQGEANECTAPVSCCLPSGDCQDLDPICCILQGGIPGDPGSSCGADLACCLPDGSCVNTDENCCLGVGGTPQAPGSACAGDGNSNGTDDACETGSPEACCLPDGSCVELTPAVCVSQGGTSQGTGSVCTTPQSCCLPDGSCVDVDPLCCDDLGGTPGGVGTSCGVAEACCFGETCRIRSVVCCTLAGGIPEGPGSACNPPTISCPGDLSVSCDQPIDPPGTGTPTVGDECDTTVDVSFSDAETPGACPQERVITRTWTATDADGQSASCEQTITVEDNTPPVITCPNDTVIECTASTDPSNTGSASATDNCDPAVDVTFSDSVAPGACPQERVISRTWTATDDCGNPASCVQTITVEDNTPPMISCPGDVTVDCNAPTDPGSTGSASASDNCDLAVDVTFSDSIAPGACPQERVISRTWTATDDCNNSSECVQLITVEDNTPPDVACPATVTVTCPGPDGVPVGDVLLEATASDNCDPAVDITDDRPATLYPPSCGNTGTIVTFTATDDCGNSSQCTVEVVVVGVPCCEPQACCLPNGACVEVLPSACAAQGGELQGVGSQCTAAQACCLPGGSCQNLDPLCCVSQNGTPGGPGSACEGDVDLDGIDGRCGDNCPEDPNKINPGPCPCGVPNVDTDGDGVLDCDDACPGADDHLDSDGDGTPDCLEDQPVPTASGWGLTIMALLLLTLGRVYFGRREADAGSC